MAGFRGFWALVTGKGEQSIYRRILRAALWGSSFTFVSICSMLVLQNVMIDRGEKLAAHVGDSLETAVEDELKRNLTEITFLKAQYTARLLRGCAINAEFLANKMTDILQNKNEHLPKNLPVANYEEIPSHVPYVYYNPELMSKGIPDAIRREVGYASSVGDDATRITLRYYGSVCIGSKNGYMVRMDLDKDDDAVSVLCREPMRSTYNHLERDWYRLTKEANRRVYTAPYIGSNGKPCVSVCVPYYDEDGFAGVVALDIDTGYIDERIRRADVDGTGFTFLLGNNGEVILSPVEEGVFAENMDADLRKAGTGTLAETAERMTRGQRVLPGVCASRGYRLERRLRD